MRHFLLWLASLYMMHANALTPLREANWDLEKIKKVTTAKVLLVDYDLVKADFPELKHKSEKEIDDWLDEYCAYVSAAQAEQSDVNSIISVNGESEAYRPPDYGRAMVFKVPGGLIDAKGVGAKNPKNNDHSNGLASLGEVVREFIYEQGIRRVFAHSQTGIETVKNYAVIDYGFDLKNGDASLDRAGAVLRQAHVRAPGRSSLFTVEQMRPIEKILRVYGVTSAGAYRDKFEEDHVNIQGADDGSVLDFGAFLSLEKFDRSRAVHFDVYNGEILSTKEVPVYQPDPSLRLPFEQWGFGVTGKEDPKFDNPWVWSHELAQAIKEGRADRSAAETHLKNFIEPLEAKLAKAPRSLLLAPCRLLQKAVQ